jgi:serine/threonine protein kinase
MFDHHKLIVQGNLGSTSTPGTSPYMAPEVQKLHQVSTKSDVYSFGILLIEIVSGKKTFNVEGENVSLRDFTKWAKNNYEEGQFEDILDSMINNSIVDLNHYEAQKLMKISLECIQENANQRPNMQNILQMLQILDARENMTFNFPVWDNFKSFLQRFKYFNSSKA